MRPGGIRIRKRSIAKLLRDVDAGRFAIPHLQREFVWDGPKAAKLLDSILRAMPVGVILIWDTPRSQRLHLRQKYHVLPPFNHKNRRVWFLIDGQQRVSVLHHARQGDQLANARRRDIDFSRIVLSLNREEDGQKNSLPAPAGRSLRVPVNRAAPALEAEAQWTGEAKAGACPREPRAYSRL